MLEKVRLALRLTTNELDDELSDMIDACKQDLLLVGIYCADETDPLIKRAVILYVKANFGSGVDNGRCQRSYDTLKCSLSLSGKYK